MLITLEHNGTKQHIDAVTKLIDYIEEEHGITTQAVSSHYSDEIFGYDDEDRQIFSVSLPLDKFDYGNISYILNMMD